MAYDGILINSIVEELRENIISGRVDKIHQPEKDLLFITIWCKSKSRKILLSSNPISPRIHITKEERENPKSPPMFCMLLRKHLLTGKVVDIVQPNFDRVVEIHIEIINEFGDLTIKKVIIECMGKHSNIILVDEKSKIIDSIKHISFETSRVREILPGKMYIYPLLKEKISPLSDHVDIYRNLSKNISTVNSTSISTIGTVDSTTFKQEHEMITSNFSGISKVTAQEIVYRKKLSGKLTLTEAFKQYFDKVKLRKFDPTLLLNESFQPVDILPFKYLQFPDELQRDFKSPSELVDYFYFEREKAQRTEQLFSTLSKVIRNNLEKLNKKLSIQMDELQEASKSDSFRLYGELLTAHLHLPLSGLDEIVLTDYNKTDLPKIIIPMDKHKSPVQNAQDYFKKYSKAKNAAKVLADHISSTNEEIDYLESQLYNVEKCTEEIELEEIYRELIAEHYIKETSKKSRKTRTPSVPHSFISTDGFEIYVGKNNMQNDNLTLKIAAVNDIWMHTKNIPGSHVIIRCNNKSVPQSTILEGAMLAAYFSKARHSANIPVDYCPRKNVKKPKGAKPGMVTYEKYRTIYVTPQENIIKRIFGAKLSKNI